MRCGHTLLVFLVLVALPLVGCGDDKKTDNDMIADTDTDDGDSTADVDTDLPPQCTSDGDCANPDRPRCSDNGICVNCLESADCEFANPICSTVTNICSPCAISPECAETVYGDICDLDNGVCIECLDDNDCTDPERGLCDNVIGQCVECEVGFDCSDPAMPTCSANEEGATVCAVWNECTGDDGREAQSDDGPAGATDITPIAGLGMTTVSDPRICNAPSAEEMDWYVFDVEDGNNATVTITWDPMEGDLDLSLYDANGLLYGDSWWRSPEQVVLTNLPAGRVYASVIRFDSADDPVAINYEINLEVTAGGCATVADCAAEFETQIFRGNCNPAGACVRIDGEGALDPGDLCDSPDDCVSNECTYGRTAFQDFGIDRILVWAAYTANADTRSFCTSTCNAVLPCDNMMTQYCTATFGSSNHCAEFCTSALDCPVNILGQPAAGDAWQHLPCSQGLCTPP